MNDTWGRAMRRTGRVERVTKETSVLVELDLDGSGTADISTGVAFFDHMLSQLAKHGLLDLSVRTTGDIEVDAHHTVEDTALALGQALRDALGDKAGICRFGDAAVPLDETLARAAIDLSGRPYLVHVGAGWHRPADRHLRHHADQAFLRVRDVHGGYLPAPGGDRAQPASPGRGAVQGGGPGAAGGGGPGPPGARDPQHQGRPVSAVRFGSRGWAVRPGRVAGGVLAAGRRQRPGTL